jgi:hypothetical protein
MSPVSLRRSRLHTILLWTAPLAWLGCGGGGGGTDIVLPALSVTTATDGVELDPDGYNLVIDGSAAQPIGVAGTLVVEQLTDGQHVIELSGLSANCAAQGENPRTVSVRSGSTASVAFAVRCSATTGSIEVATSTSGNGSDPDGFTVVLDANPWGPIGTGATADLAGVVAGAHSVGLSGLAANCQVNGENPRPVAVSPGETIQVPFNVTCTDPGSNLGTLTVTTVTSGSDQDPDGYSVALDGAASQPIGINASITLPNLAGSSHRVELTGVAANCSVSGTNPRAVTVAPGGSETVTFRISCTAPPAGAGTIQVTATTTGADLDDAYTVTLDGGSSQAIGANATISLANVSAAEHQVRLQGIAGNCTVQGSNPVRVTVASGAVAQAGFNLTCTARPPEPGSIRVTVATSGGDQDNSFTLSVDGGSAQALSGSRTIQNVAAGAHTVLLGDIASNCTLAGSNPQSVTVVAGQMATIAFQVSCVSTGPSTNLRIQRISLSQSTQDDAGDVPLVQSRDGYLRVFVTATNGNGVAPSVRVRFYRGGSVVQSFNISAPGGSTPSTIQEGSLQSSWNLRVPGSVLQPNTAVLADVDPDNTVAETSETDNSFPASGSPLDLAVQHVDPLAITFVPIRQSANGLTGEVGNPNQMLDLAERIYPLNGISTSSHPVFTVEGPLQAFDVNRQWIQTVEDLEALRVAENATDQTYVGMVKLEYGRGSGTVGSSYYTPGTATAVVTDQPSDVREVMAHELGHTFGQLHTPCGTPGAQDPNFPYPGGFIGVYGIDVAGAKLEPPTTPDIMGYCDNPWISDYIYKRVLNYRRSNPLRVDGAAVQPTMLVWGHIINGQAVLEPAFLLESRPHLPRTRGPYTVEARASDGSGLFTLSFDAAPMADDAHGSRHFAFAVPLDPAQAARVGSLKLSGPGIQVMSVEQRAGLLRTATATQDDFKVRSDANGATVEWNAAAHPMVMVRDPDTGQVLSFARGGKVRVWTGKKAVDLEVSNGLGSQRVRLAINR